MIGRKRWTSQCNYFWSSFFASCFSYPVDFVAVVSASQLFTISPEFSCIINISSSSSSSSSNLCAVFTIRSSKQVLSLTVHVPLSICPNLLGSLPTVFLCTLYLHRVVWVLNYPSLLSSLCVPEISSVFSWS